MNKRIITLMVTCVLVIFVSGGSLSDAFISEEIPGFDFDSLVYDKYDEIMGTTESGETGFIYSDWMLMVNQYQYSTDLVKASAVLAAAGYETRYVNDFFEKMGYNNYVNRQFENDRTIHDNDKVAFTIGWKYSEMFNTTLWCIVIRGTKVNDEWFSNFNLGHSGNHWGFHQAATQVLSFLDAYVSQYGSGNNAFWFTGHSRGAAVANIMAADYTHRGYKVFGYTFACPAVSKNADTSLSNIYNINNKGDVVTIVPLKEWGYKRHGITKEYSLTSDPVFTEAFYINNQSKYAAPSNSVNYRRILLTIVPNENDYYNPIRHFGIMLVAAVLGGYDFNMDTMTLVLHTFVDENADVKDFSLKRILGTLWDEAVKWAGDKFSGIVRAIDVLGFFKAENEDSIKRDIERWTVFANSSLAETSGYSEEEFQEYYEAHELTMLEITDYTGVIIETQDDLELALARLTNDNDCATETELILSCVSDLCANTSNLLSSVEHGHYHGVYLQFVNEKYFGYKGLAGLSVSDVSIGYDITSIGTNCFLNCKNLQSLDIPNSVIKLGQGICFGCSSLSSIQFSNSLQQIPIGCCFECNNLTEIDIPSSVLTVEQQAFWGCNNVQEVTIPVGVDRPFILSSPVIRRIHYTVNDAGTELKDRNNIQSDNNNGYQNTMEYLSLNTLEEIVFDDGITRIGDFAFYGGYGSNILTQIVFPSTLKSIGKCTFSGQNGVMTIPSNDSNDNGVIFPEGLEVIGDACFNRCNGIEKVILPSGMVSIGSNGFSYCSGLKEVLFNGDIDIIGNGAFGGCWYLEKVTFNGTVSEVGEATFQNCGNLFDFQIPQGLTEISDWFLGGCEKLEQIIIPDGVTSIGMGAFSGLGIKTLTIPDSVIEIGENAFAYCRNLTDAHISEGLTSMSAGMFDGCQALKSVYIPAGITRIGLTAFRETGFTDLSFIPETVNCIGEEAFEMCANLERITIPDTINSVERQAFQGCENLKEVNLSSTLESISQACFAFCPSLQFFTVPENVTEICSYALSSCDNLELLFLPEGLTTIGEYSLSDNPNLTVCVYKDSYAEQYCSSNQIPYITISKTIEIPVLRLPSSLETIEDEAFIGISAFSIYIDDGVKSIGSNAFANCINLRQVRIPEDAYIEMDAFDNSINGVLTVFGKKGSLAEEFANNNQRIVFIPEE